MTDLSSKDCLSINETNTSQKLSLKEKESGSRKSSSNSPNKSPKRKKHSSSTVSNLNLNDQELNEPRSKDRKRKSTASPSKIIKLESSTSNQVTDFALSKATRCDFYGNIIKKGASKTQRVTFIDKISNKSFVNIIEIDSFKKFNFDLNNDHASCNCACLIF